MKLYHGSNSIIRKPKFGQGKPYNDYGLGFYCTEDKDIAMEWACPTRNDGYVNSYEIDLQKMKVVDLSGEDYSVLSWMAILLENRKFDITSNIAFQAKAYLLENFLPDIGDADIVVGYRADDSYFSFAEDFINNTISVRDLAFALHLGNLGIQTVIKSKKAFNKVAFIEAEPVDHREYHYRRMARDLEARRTYKERKANLEVSKEDVFVLDIIREGIKNDDPRLR